jgi:tRNA(Ile)-lysidine synthase
MAARDGRYRLLSDWIGERGILFLGHTQDDQAETFLMRLRRGSGVDGLAAMQMQTRRGNTTLLRPMLGLRREELRSYLNEVGVTWCEDPTNENDAYERVRMRKAMGQLQELGLDASRLAKTAEHMARAKEALNARAYDMARTISRQELNSAVFEWEALACLEEETRFRLISAALLWVSKTTYRPRYASLVEAWDHIMRGKSVTLAGCLITASKRRGIRVMREINAQPNNAQFCEGMTWDMGWTIGGPCQNGLSIRPLGQDGLRQITGPYDANLPKRLCYTQPAIFDQETLIACPSLVKHSAYSVAFSADTPFLSAFAH